MWYVPWGGRFCFYFPQVAQHVQQGPSSLFLFRPVLGEAPVLRSWRAGTRPRSSRAPQVRCRGARGDGRARLNRRLRRWESRWLLWPGRLHRVLPGQGLSWQSCSRIQGLGSALERGTADSGAVRWPARELTDPVLEGCEPGQALSCQECF